MTPDERQLLSGLFDRIRTAGTQQRDREAEAFIGDAVRTQPYAPYLLSQTVIVQDQALRAANDRLQQLEARVKELEGGQHAGTGGETSFLGSLGRSIFGSGDPPQQSRPSVPQTGYAPQNAGSGGQQGGYNQGGFAQGGPWAQGGGAAQGGGFLKGALGAAAGVAGGVLLANSISGLMHGNQFGIGSGMPGFGGGMGYPGGGETVINNYYENDRPDGGSASGDTGDYGPADNASWDDGGFGSDDGGGFGSDDGSANV